MTPTITKYKSGGLDIDVFEIEEILGEGVMVRKTAVSPINHKISYYVNGRNVNEEDALLYLKLNKRKTIIKDIKDGEGLLQ